MEQEQQGSAAPMDDAFDEGLWASAKSGGEETRSGQSDEPAATLGQPTPSPDSADTPAVATPTESTPATAQAALAPDPAPAWTPEQVTEWQQKARHFDSVQGNWNQITQKWEQERLTPLQQELEQERQKRLELEQQQEAVKNWYISQQRPEVQAKIRESFQQEQLTKQQQLAEQQQRHQTQLERQQIQAERQQLQAQQQELLRTNIVGSIDGFITDFAKEAGVPVAELREYVEANNLRDTLKRTPLHQIGPLMAGIEHYATVRSRAIAKENAAKAAQAGTYRVEGAEGAGGQGKAEQIAKMNAPTFESLWSSVTGRTA